MVVKFERHSSVLVKLSPLSIDRQSNMINLRKLTPLDLQKQISCIYVGLRQCLVALHCAFLGNLGHSMACKCVLE